MQCNAYIIVNGKEVTVGEIMADSDNYVRGMDIIWLRVRPDFRLRGIGRTLVKKVASYGYKHHGTGCVYITLPLKRARKFYKRCGFVRSNVNKDWECRNCPHL